MNSDLVIMCWYPKQYEQIYAQYELCVYVCWCYRKSDAGNLALGHSLVFSLTVPPRSPYWELVGHCSSVCTSASLPPQGINVFIVFLHGHYLGQSHFTFFLNSFVMWAVMTATQEPTRCFFLFRNILLVNLKREKKCYKKNWNIISTNYEGTEGYFKIDKNRMKLAGKKFYSDNIMK